MQKSRENKSVKTAQKRLWEAVMALEFKDNIFVKEPGSRDVHMVPSKAVVDINAAKLAESCGWTGEVSDFGKKLSRALEENGVVFTSEGHSISGDARASLKGHKISARVEFDRRTLEKMCR